ncbi:MAG: transglutaminase domain-containing protein [Thermodesulfobacteriota bacterium]|nr:transglutaminase domain-containing protein [Thermodesulfobacteriota bacterium]
MDLKRRKRFFSFFGACIIILWLFMIGQLVKRVAFDVTGSQPGLVADEVSAVESHETDWMEIYLKGKKVGYSMNQISPFGEYYLIREEILLKLGLMGQPSVMRAITRCIVDHEFILKNFRFRMTSGVVTFQVTGRVDGDGMHLTVGEGPSQKTNYIKLSAPPMIGSGTAQFFKGRPIEVGQSFKFPIFDPSTMAQTELIIEVADKEGLVINGIRYGTFRLETEMWGQQMTFWLDERGSVLKEEGFMGLTLIKSSAARASEDIEGGVEEDFYEMAAIDVKRKLLDPDRLIYLKLKIEGLDETHFDTGILNDGRQKLSGGILEIIKEKRPLKATYNIPYPDYSGEMAPYLEPELSVESDDRLIMEKVRKIAGDTNDPVTVATRLLAWVHENVEKRPVVTVPSATEVLKTRVGDCNEHTVLLTALLRGAGIPARICVGLVYARGKFFYHAWTEGYLGRWISMDATTNQTPVDATHIKLVQGGLDRQVEIIGLIGKLKLEIIEYKYD